MIGVCLPNTPEFPIATLGGIEGGYKITTVNPIYTAGKYLVRQTLHNKSGDND